MGLPLMRAQARKMMLKKLLTALAVSGGLALAAPAAQALAMPLPAVLPASQAVAVAPEAVLMPGTTVSYPSVLPVTGWLHAAPGKYKATFTWGAVAGAAVYELRVSPVSGGATTRFDRVLGASLRYGATVTLHTGRYAVTVRAGRSWGDVHGHWAALRYFTVAVPAPVYSLVAAHALAWALTQAGKWYAWGGTGPSTYDCSGLVMMAYEHAGVQLPRTTYEMLASSRLHRVYSPQAGDLAFYGSGHVELYVRPGVTFGAHESGKPVSYAYYSGSSWRPTAFYRVA